MEEISKATGEMAKAEVGQPHFIPKKGSIFPPKRISVKKMVLDSILLDSPAYTQNMERSSGVVPMVESLVAEQRCIPNGGSVIPRKRRLVKKMMLDSILKFIATNLCCLNHHKTRDDIVD